MEKMSAPQTTSATKSSGTNGTSGAFPAEVVAFAAANQVEHCLQPLLEATHHIFPTADWVKVEIDDDPEIRDDRHILYNVQVAGLPLTESRVAARKWNDAAFRICPAPLVTLFRLGMDLKN
jgi:hypothetical protein